MKNLNALFVLVLFVAAVLASSCSTQKGCKGKGGGWYGDRNLTSVEMQQPSSEVNEIEVTATEHCSD